MNTSITRLDYCQYLLVSQINYTLTHFAGHREQFNHNAINRYPQGERVALYGHGSRNWGHMRSLHSVNPVALPWQSTSRHYPNSAMALTVIL